MDDQALLHDEVLKTYLREPPGYGYGRHYNVLFMVFLESVSMNAVCLILLLISSAYGVVSLINHPMGSLINVWVAIIPAVQMGSAYPYFGQLSLQCHLSWRLRIVRKLG